MEGEGRGQRVLSVDVFSCCRRLFFLF